MGNCFSANDTVSLRDLVARHDVPPEQPMSAKIIRQGLTTVAATLHSKGQHISIVAVGGAVNTLLLNTRESTGDVDFFYRTKTKHEDVANVTIAADAAATKLKLGEHWLNNHTALFIEEGAIQHLYDEAVTQNENRLPGSRFDGLRSAMALCLEYETGPSLKGRCSSI